MKREGRRPAGAAQYAIAVSELADRFQDQPCVRCGTELDRHIIWPGADGKPAADCPRRYGDQAAHRIDLTQPGPHMNGIEVHLPSGIIHAGTGVNPRTLAPVTEINIEVNTPGRAVTAPGGDWVAELHDRIGPRIDVILTKQKGRP